jgi:tetratricopeptide (TPR) repeat protein
MMLVWLLMLAAVGTSATIAQEPIKVPLPNFASPEEAVAWAEDRQITEASQEELRQVASAAHIATTWPNASEKVVARASVLGAEAFLRLSAPENARSILARAKPGALKAESLETIAHLRYGESCEFLGDWAEARASYTRALRNASASFQVIVRYRLGVVLFRLNDYPGAVASLEQVSRNEALGSREAAEARAFLASAYRKLQRLDTATQWGALADEALAEGPRQSAVKILAPVSSDAVIRRMAAGASLE